MGNDRRVDELRERLRALGYLDAGVNRFVLGATRGTRRPAALAVLSSLRVGALAVHGAGTAKARGRFPLSELTPSPRFEEMAKTVDGYGERVEHPGELPAALKRGLAAVREGRPAVLNVLCQRAVS